MYARRLRRRFCFTKNLPKFVVCGVVSAILDTPCIRTNLTDFFS